MSTIPIPWRTILCYVIIFLASMIMGFQGVNIGSGTIDISSDIRDIENEINKTLDQAKKEEIVKELGSSKYDILCNAIPTMCSDREVPKSNLLNNPPPPNSSSNLLNNPSPPNLSSIIKKLPIDSDYRDQCISSDHGDPRGKRKHTGIDIPLDIGADVTSIAEGKIIRRALDVGVVGGYYIKIEHELDDGTKITSTYAHLRDWAKVDRYNEVVGNTPYPKVGENVGSGQKIGFVGGYSDNGVFTPEVPGDNATGANLHLEITYKQDGDLTPFYRDYIGIPLCS